MKHLHIYIIVIALIFGGAKCSLRAQDLSSLYDAEQIADSKTLKFKEQSWNFGDIKEDGGDVSHIFSFTNITDSPIVILDVSASCGCTTPTFSRKPIMPNQTGAITVTFAPINRPGKFSNGVSVKLSNNERIT